LAGDTEWLAGKSCRDDVRNASIKVGTSRIKECSDIGKDGGVVEQAVFDPLGKHSLAVVVDFDIAYRSPAKHILRGEKPSAGTGE